MPDINTEKKMPGWLKFAVFALICIGIWKSPVFQRKIQGAMTSIAKQPTNVMPVVHKHFCDDGKIVSYLNVDTNWIKIDPRTYSSESASCFGVRIKVPLNWDQFSIRLASNDPNAWMALWCNGRLKPKENILVPSNLQVDVNFCGGWRDQNADFTIEGRGKLILQAHTKRYPAIASPDTEPTVTTW